MLTIRDLNHIYPNGVCALDHVSIDIPKGMFGLLGPNGAGKSSLMRTLATLQQPSSGTILFDGVDVVQQPDQIRQVLGYLPQDFGVYPRGSALELLDHLAVLKGVLNRSDRKRLVEHLLVQTNLYEARKKHVSTFSGGMRQRFGIAQALIGNPQLIIVDEPTAGLDPEERNRFHNLLSEIGEEMVVILSTHIVDDVADLCPNMAILANGKIVAQGTPSELMSKLKDQVWEKVIPKSELNAYRRTYKVLSQHLSSGKMVIRLHSTTKLGHGFFQVPVQLEDVYFYSISQLDTPASDEEKLTAVCIGG